MRRTRRLLPQCGREDDAMKSRNRCEGDMIYTVGERNTYDRYIAEDANPRKKGRVGQYCGGSVWEDPTEAARHAPLGYGVYGVIANWELDTSPSLSGGPWHDLLVDARILHVRAQINTPK